ncbi:hypothetical protein CcaverHIS002_0107560 [Cutaneotrichosporon cavernicola]|uniref:Ubiquitin-like domain-containing protein n=1 Tax=Cutaneotrichosporon cavernicola TaxID=279322 RepID=A0AA48IDW5_9TREE|nr:uncharacterized protein CcaverHIS019_0107510 [Cutaneotrichosporon cavernicola]BEI80227.1 hypothetical protein CcaverHIS002_0107560 [Cutaneotrichosporon cavernicola]BEI88033.1 hypothetical protein CcaverHIS019_0107510 [Cutaneotrichosporon cavernicola]BEI95806.1 hypothetical protein CcaverHIS631_0107550 [Cutaneotrichosporon cavernicola]BEJ03579.1 hypothetical protein CcaverHIS641_0107540 [Cutaneotrichosporon cavernicola]
MDAPLAGERIAEEKAFAARYVSTIDARPVEYPSDYAPPLEGRPRKTAVLHTPVIAPPEVADAEGSQDGSINVTIKSLKPALQLTLTVSLSDSVADLKKAAAAAGAPAPDLQRLLLKGKALADAKLLKEYDIPDGAVINLLAKAPSPSAPAPSQIAPEPIKGMSPGRPSHLRAPSLTITTTDAMNIDADFASDVSPEPPSPVSGANFHRTLSAPDFWHKVHNLCQDEFRIEAEADTVFDCFLMSVKNRLSASETAKIRDEVGVTGMGGGV